MDYQQEVKEELAVMRKQLASEPRVFAHVADCYMRLGKSKAAIKVLNNGLDQFPEYAAGWVVKGNVHLLLDQPKQARAAFERALKFDPTNIYAHELCYELAQDARDFAGYVNHLRDLTVLDPLDKNSQSMYQTATLRKAAVDSKLFTPQEVEKMMPSLLRQTLLKHNLLPADFERTHERFYIQSDPNDSDLRDSAATGAEELEEEVETETQPQADFTETETTTYDTDSVPAIDDEPTEREDEFKPDPSKRVSWAGMASDAEVEADDSAEAETAEDASEIPEDEGVIEPAALRDADSAVEEPTMEEAASEAAEELEPEPAPEAALTPPPAPLKEPLREVVIEHGEARAPAEHKRAEDTAREELKAVASEVTGLKAPAPASPPIPASPSPSSKPRRIATKTLGELYASQEDWGKSVEVYEELLERHPNNEAYIKRLADLRSKLESSDE